MNILEIAHVRERAGIRAAIKIFFKDFVSVKRQKIKRGASQTYDTPPFLF